MVDHFVQVFGLFVFLFDEFRSSLFFFLCIVNEDQILVKIFGSERGFEASVDKFVSSVYVCYYFD